MTTYRDLLVWQRGMDLVEHVYRFTATLPAVERFGVTAQLQRAALSIPSNTAEGHSRRTTGAYLNHVSIAIGSQAEVETLLEACGRLKFGDDNMRGDCIRSAAETGKMLYGLHSSLERTMAHKRLLLYSIILVVPGLWYLASGLFL